MNGLIKTNENINDIAIAHFDEVDELLKEINATDLYFAVSPMSVQYKRLYVIGDLLYNSSIKITATLPEDFQEQYEVRLKLGETYQSIDNFMDATNTVSGSYQSFGNKHLNAVPLDVLVISKTITESATSISFEITANDGASCDDCVSTFTTIINGYQQTPMQYGDAHYTLTINGVEYKGSMNSVVGTSLSDGFSAVYANNGQLYGIMQYYISSSNNGEIYLENYMYECVSISLKADITYTYNTNILETRTLIEHLALCAGNGAPT